MCVCGCIYLYRLITSLLLVCDSPFLPFLLFPSFPFSLVIWFPSVCLAQSDLLWFHPFFIYRSGLRFDLVSVCRLQYGTFHVIKKNWIILPCRMFIKFFHFLGLDTKKFILHYTNYFFSLEKFNKTNLFWIFHSETVTRLSMRSVWSSWTFEKLLHEQIIVQMKTFL